MHEKCMKIGNEYSKIKIEKKGKCQKNQEIYFDI